VFPRVLLNVVLAFLFATFLGVGAAVLTDVLDNTVRDPDQVARLMNADVIGSLPAVKDWRRKLSPLHHAGALNGHVNGNGNGHSNGNGHGKAIANGNGKGALTALMRGSANGDQALSNYEEAIRTLRNSILLTDFDRRLKSVLLTSGSPSEGKSTVAAHLAATHAGQHKRTLLIDGDLRRPSVHRLFQVPNTVGLSNVLLKQVPWLDAVVILDEPKGLDILPAGPSTRRASDLMGAGMAELIEEATREYDLVVVDAPPLLGFAEPLQLATAVDGVIVVARAGDTSRKALGSVIATLARLRANLVGVVLNEVHREVSAGYYYYYGHYSKYYSQRETK
jgi:capsular exopolysaccharide synthesis family protein